MPTKLSLPASFDVWALLLLWCAAVVLVNPIGDFPLNDDWAYGQNTHALAVENRLFFSDWPAMTLIAHTLWGTLFCKIFGFSFTVLRFSNLLMGLFGIAAFYQILNWAGLSRRMVWFATLLFAFNPLWFVLANSYMTDVPFLSLLLWSVFFFLKTLENPSPRILLLATFFALWACLIRQLGLLVPGVFLLLFFYYQPLSWRNAFFAVLPAVVCFAAIEMFTHWLKAMDQLPFAYTGLSHLVEGFLNNPKIVAVAVERTGLALMTVGLFLLPLSVGIFSKKMGRSWGAWLLLLPGAYCVWAVWGLFPNGNVFYNLGLGPKLLKDAFWNVHADPQLPQNWFWLITGAAAVGAGLLLLSLWPGKAASLRHSTIRSFSLWFSAAYLGFVCANWLLIDRYLLPLMVFLLLFLATAVPRLSKISFVLLGLTVFFSVAATHDYLAWNRARWNAIGQLTAQGATPAQMDGGFEFNGWHRLTTTSQRTPGMKSWWFVRDDEWVVTFGPVWGYDPVMTVTWPRWLPPGTDTVMASRRKPYVLRDSVWCDMEQITPDSMAFLPEAGSLQPGNGSTRSSERAHSGQFSAKLEPSVPFGATISLDTFRLYDRLVIRVWRYPSHAEAGIVVTAEDPAKGYFFEPAYVMERDSAGWGLMELPITMPESAVGSKGRLYLWNPSSHQTAWFDDLKVYRYRLK